MPFMRRNRQSKSENRRDDTGQDESEDILCLQKILKRVSVISSSMIKVLREIREGILMLFRTGVYQQVVSDENPVLDIDESSGNSRSSSLSFTDRFSKLRKRIVCPRRRDRKKVVIASAHCIQDDSQETCPGNINNNTESSPIEPRASVNENIQSKTAENGPQKCSHKTKDHEEILTLYTKNVQPSGLTKDERKDIAKRVAAVMQYCFEYPETFNPDGGSEQTIHIESHIVKMVRDEILTKLGSKATFSEPKPVKQNNGTELKNRQVQDKTTPTHKARYKSHLTQAKLLSNPGNVRTADLITDLARTADIVTGVTHAKKKKVSGVAQSTALHVSGVTQTANVPGVTHATAMSISGVTQTPNVPGVTQTTAMSVAGVTQIANVPGVTQAGSCSAVNHDQRQSGAEGGTVVRTPIAQETTCSSGQAKKDLPADNIPFIDVACPECYETNEALKQVGVIARPSNENLVKDYGEITCNCRRLDNMIQTVIRHCMTLYLRQQWQYNMRLVAKIHQRPNGTNDWSALCCDFLYSPASETGAPNVVESRVAKFERLVDMDPNCNLTEIYSDVQIEQRLQALQRIVVTTTLTDIRHNQPDVLASLELTGELCWCPAVLDLMTFIGYYTMIGCARNTQHALLPDDDTQLEKTIKHDILRRFNHDIRCLVERMRNAVDDFVLYDIHNDADSIRSDVATIGSVECQVTENPEPDCTVQPVDGEKTKKEKKHGRKKSRNTTQNHSSHSKIPDEPQAGAVGAGEPDETQQQESVQRKNTIELGRHAKSENAAEAAINNALGEIHIQLPGLACNAGLNDDTENTSEIVDLLDVKQDVSSDYVNYIETNNTLDYGALEVVAGHGETPNKKKLFGVIREKKKTKGIPNKHLQEEQTQPSQEFYDYELPNTEEDDETVDDAPNDGSTAAACAADTVADDKANDTEDAEAEAEVVTVLSQVLDDREFNLVPEEVLRKDDSKLRDLEEAYTVSSAEKKKDKHRKKREKKNKPVKIQLVFDS